MKTTQSLQSWRFKNLFKSVGYKRLNDSTAITDMFSAYYNMANFPTDRLERSFSFRYFLQNHILRHQFGSDSKGKVPPTESAPVSSCIFLRESPQPQFWTFDVNVTQN